MSVITQSPFREINQYISFVQNRDVCLFILDERLNDQSNDDDGPVDYKGNDLVSFLRTRLKNFPIFAVTNFSEDEELLEKMNQFEYIVNRNLFIKEGDNYVPIIIRAAQKYLDLNVAELSEFDKLTKKIAGGDSDPKLMDKLRALQVYLELPYVGFDERQKWLSEYEKQIQELEILKNILKEKLKDKKKSTYSTKKSKSR